MNTKHKSPGNILRKNKSSSNKNICKSTQSSKIFANSAIIKSKLTPPKNRTTANSKTKIKKNQSYCILSSSQRKNNSPNNNTTQITNNVRVYIRFRPLNKLENNLLSNGIGWYSPIYQDNKVLTLETRKNPLSLGPSFSFDQIFDDSTSQEEVFNTVGKDIVTDIIHGYNGTIFAYGQSGSGKTFTMYGSNEQPITSASIGLVPRIVHNIFNHVQECNEDVTFQLKLSMLQIYKEIIYDLLTGEKDLKIKESPIKGIYVDGLSEVYLSTYEDFEDYYHLALQNRIISDTKLNHNSSRSHSIMIFEVTQSFSKENFIRKGRLNLVDLAGSEKISKTGVVGETLEEAKKINLSLSALGNVIYALTTHADYVPYRNSKLTRILTESLGGNYKTSLIITCSPHSYHLDETLSSIQFGQRAKNITNKVKVNIRLSYEELLSLIEKLKVKLRRAHDVIRKGNQGDINNNVNSDNQCSNCILMKERENVLNNKINAFIETIKQKDYQISQLKLQLESKNRKESNVSTNIYEQLLIDIKTQLTQLQNAHNTLITNHNDIHNMYFTQQSNYFQFIKDNMNTNYNNININEFIIKNFSKFNSFYSNSINPILSNNYKDIYEQYIDSLKQIFQTQHDIQSKHNLPLFYVYFLYEYIQLYFQHQTLSLSYTNISNLNNSLCNINNTLSSIIEELLQINNDLTFNIAHYNLYNHSIIEQRINNTDSNKPNNEDNKILFNPFNDIFHKRRPYKIHSLISKRSLDIMKAVRNGNSTRLSFSNGKYSHIYVDDTSINKNKFDIEQSAVHADKKQSKFKMLRDGIISTIKHNENIKQAINALYSEMKLNSGLNRKFINDLIKGNDVMLEHEYDVYFDKLYKAHQSNVNLSTSEIILQTTFDDVNCNSNKKELNSITKIKTTNENVNIVESIKAINIENVYVKEQDVKDKYLEGCEMGNNKYKGDNQLEDFITKYMETGTATRRFDGIKVQYENNQIKCNYAGGLNAENKFELIPLQNEHITQIGGDIDSLLNESVFTDK